MTNPTPPMPPAQGPISKVDTSKPEEPKPYSPVHPDCRPLVMNAKEGPYRGLQVVYQDNYDQEPCPAIVTHVWPSENGRLVNLTIFTRDGDARGAVRVYRGATVGTWRPFGASE